MDKQFFFEKASQAIFSSSNPTQSLQCCFAFLKTVFPVDGLYLDVHDPSLSTVKSIVAICDKPRFRTEEVEPILDVNDRSSQEFSHTSFGDNVLVASRLESKDGFICSSMTMELKLKHQFKVLFSVQAEGERRYSGKDATLYSLLHNSLCMVVSNFFLGQELARNSETPANAGTSNQSESLPDHGTLVIGGKYGLSVSIEQACSVISYDSPVLLAGETGTGKDVIANFLHENSPRRRGNFVKINCGAIPENLIDSELFGHEKGAFTGAHQQKIGRFERSSGGTIFLDEVGELPLQAQVRLLRVLQNKEIERVGGTETIPVDIRVISATNRSLEDMVKEGTFREDLWYRLNVFPIMIPPLRQRLEDIPALLHYFLEKKRVELNIPASPDLAAGALERLMEYNWPGNVRELENVVERELILSLATEEGNTLGFTQLYAKRQPTNVITAEAEVFTPRPLDELLTGHFRRILDITQGKIYGDNGAAVLLDINPDTLRNKLKKLDIPFGRQFQKNINKEER